MTQEDALLALMFGSLFCVYAALSYEIWRLERRLDKHIEKEHKS